MGCDLIVQVNVDWTVIRTFYCRLDVTVLEPRQQAFREEKVVNSCAIVRNTGIDLLIPAFIITVT